MIEKPKWSRPAVAAALLLWGCTKTQLGADLHSADTSCEDRHFKDKTALVACLAKTERPVWARDEPATIDLYDDFAKQRTELARQYDSGAITQQQYRDRLDQLTASTRTKLTERRRQTATAQ